MKNFLHLDKQVNEVWIKNFYYNRNSILKLIYLYSFLKNESFLEILSKKISYSDFLQSEDSKNSLIKINEVFLIKPEIYELNFGFLWFYDFHMIFYFKDDFDYDEFIQYFLKIESSKNIVWISAEFFDNNIKILEIFKKNSFIRNFRNEILNEKSKKIKSIQKQNIDLSDKNFLSFIKKYENRKIKLIFYFVKN